MGYKFKGQLWSGLREALQAAPGHSVLAFFDWEDRGFFGRKKKEYALTISRLTEQEARQQFQAARAAHYDEYIAVMCMGELPPSIREHLGADEPPYGWLVSWEGFLLLMAEHFPNAGSGDWTPA